MDEVTKIPHLVAIIGAQGTGKSTLIHQVKKTISPTKLFSIAIIREVARHCPYKIGIKSDSLAQSWIFRTQNLLEVVGNIMPIPVLSDRCLIDHYAYYRFWCGRNKKAEDIIASALSRYHTVFFLAPNPAFLEDDGVRPTDPQHQIEISELITDTINIFQGMINVVHCSDNEQPTIDKILSALGQANENIFSRGIIPWPPEQYDVEFGAPELPSFTLTEISHLLEKMFIVDQFGNGNQIEHIVSRDFPEELIQWMNSLGLRVGRR